MKKHIFKSGSDPQKSVETSSIAPSIKQKLKIMTALGTWLTCVIYDSSPSPAGTTLRWARLSVTMQRVARLESLPHSFMVFLCICDILFKDSHSLSIPSPDLAMVCHTHTHTQIVEFAFAHTCASSFHLQKIPHSHRDTNIHSQYIYLAQEVTHSCFTCLIVLLGHEMRQRKCVSMAETQGGKKGKRNHLVQCSISFRVPHQEASSFMSLIPPSFSHNGWILEEISF